MSEISAHKKQKELTTSISYSSSTEEGTSEKKKKKIKKEGKELISEFPEQAVSSNAIYDGPYIILPEKLNSDLKEINIDFVSASFNVSGNYSRYLKEALNSLLQLKGFDYESIFSEENKYNICYQQYKSSDDENISTNNNKEDILFSKHKKKKCARSISLESKKCQNIKQDNQILPKKIKSTLKKKNLPKKLLLLDLDETLIHSEMKRGKWTKKQIAMRDIATCQIETVEFFDDELNFCTIDIYIRPYLKYFLEKIFNYYDMAIFSAGVKKYVDAILQIIDPEDKYFKFKLYRESCVSIHDQVFIKDLRIIQNFSPENVILMDNSLYSFLNQPSNGMLVNSFYCDGNDTQLISAESYLLKYIHSAEDVREVNEKWFKFEKKIKLIEQSKKVI